MCIPKAAMLAYVRYRQVAENLPEDSVHSDRLNKAAFVIGLVSSFGFTLTANFSVCCHSHACLSLPFPSFFYFNRHLLVLF